MSRKVARENVYKLVFEFLFSKTPNLRTYTVLSNGDVDESDVKYMEKVYYGIIDKYDDLIKDVSDHAEGFAIDRIYKPDLSALLLAIYEMKYVDEIPVAVSINEAVELVKKYSTDKSSSFVNGILASINKSLQE